MASRDGDGNNLEQHMAAAMERDRATSAFNMWQNEVRNDL